MSIPKTQGYIGFRTYLEGLPRDTIINHATWHSCAVGEYLKHTGEYNHLDVGEWVKVNLPLPVGDLLADCIDDETVSSLLARLDTLEENSDE